MNKSEQWAVDAVAQLWCLPETSSIVMEVPLANAMVKLLTDSVAKSEARGRTEERERAALVIDNLRVKMTNADMEHRQIVERLGRQVSSLSEALVGERERCAKVVRENILYIMCKAHGPALTDKSCPLCEAITNIRQLSLPPSEPGAGEKKP